MARYWDQTDIATQAGITGSTPTTVTTGADKNYVHTQAIPATEWVVTHNLGKYPAVTIVDSGKNVVIGNIQHISINQFVLSFGFAFSGAAYCN